jgi:hypothetical protein
MMNDFAYLFPLFFILMFVGVLFVTSKKGWSDLAAVYRFDSSFEGRSIGLISLYINGAAYKNCLVLKYDHEGFYLRPVFVFRLFHRPLFVPWKDIKDIRSKKVVFTDLTELVIGNPAIALMQMKRSTFEKLEQATYLRMFQENKHQEMRSHTPL